MRFCLFNCLCIIFVLFAVFNVKIFAQKCDSKTDCASCMQEPGCAWCLEPKLRNPVPKNKAKELNHCILKNSSNIKCAEDDLVDPSSKSRIVQNELLRSKNGSVVQMKPQKFKLTLRVGQTVHVKFQYSQAENYPVDLYYIIDNSNSMKVHKKQLAKLGEELSRTILTLTKDFQIGFGSFIDKKAAPFVNEAPFYLELPCQGCIPAYGFKNHLSLTPDFKLFSEAIKELESSGNTDNPEGGFDAIMQAIVCKKEIGWRPQSRHLIILSTDADFHIAGDGKIGGVIEPNDARCYLKNHTYDGLEKDYPSVSLLNQVVKDNNVNLIFAIVKSSTRIDRLFKEYKMLAQNIANSKIDKLEANSQNVVNLVVENYKEIVSSVTMEANATDNIKVEIKPHCKNPIRNGCAKVALGEVVDFTASITLLNCAQNSKLPTFISIKPDALNESLILETTTICGCDCESTIHRSYEKNSTKCERKGDLICGKCKCNDGRGGANCECDSTNNVLDETECTPVAPGSKPCSGRGQCICAECVCKNNTLTGEIYSGKFCECDDTACEIENGKLCNGKGNCDCGKCKCFDGWTGSSCGCQDDKKSCIKSGELQVCSGRGSCDCGKCACTGNFTGKYCEVCPNCDGECVKLKTCVECTVFGTGIRDRSKCRRECVAYDIKSTTETIVTNEDEKICREVDDEKCEIIYKYFYDDLQKLIVTVQNKRNCPPNILVWIIAVAGFVLLIGLLTLFMWKIATVVHDKREFAKFLNEQKNSKWHSDGNPLYKGATTTFQNPSYAQ